MDKINDIGVGSAACCTFWIQWTNAFNAGLTVLVSFVTLAYIVLRVYRELKKINYYKKKGKKHAKNKRH